MEVSFKHIKKCFKFDWKVEFITLNSGPRECKVRPHFGTLLQMSRSTRVATCWILMTVIVLFDFPHVVVFKQVHHIFSNHCNVSSSWNSLPPSFMVFICIFSSLLPSPIRGKRYYFFPRLSRYTMITYCSNSPRFSQPSNCSTTVHPYFSQISTRSFSRLL